MLHRIRDIESPLSAREALVACLAILLVVAGGAGIRLAYGPDVETMPTWRIGGDFVQFYIAGRILNEYQGNRLYDLSLQEDLFCELVPGETWLRLPFNYPPFIAVLFRPLARLPLMAATIVFLFITPLLFAAGVWLLVSRFGWPIKGQWFLGIAGALSFAPFLLYTWLGAQISVIGFCSIAVALCEEDRGRPFLSGMALSICLYKPPLLLLVLPMLVITRRFRVLAGFAAGGTVLALTSAAVAGPQACVGFVERMIWWSRLSTLDSGLFNPLRYVDLKSFLRLLPLRHPVASSLIIAILAVVPSIVLLRAWLRFRNERPEDRLLLWAATLTWGLVLNVYTPFYDCIQVVPACVLAASAARSAFSSLHYRGLGIMMLLLYLAPWGSEICARTLRLQPYTLVLAAFGALLLILVNDLYRGVGAPATPATSMAWSSHRIGVDEAVTRPTR